MDEATTDTFHTIGLGDHQRTTSSSFPGQAVGGGGGGGVNPNPIDKLYLMQDSYFSGE